jgi:hypothetical protein
MDYGIRGGHFLTKSYNTSGGEQEVASHSRENMTGTADSLPLYGMFGRNRTVVSSKTNG